MTKQEKTAIKKISKLNIRNTDEINQIDSKIGEYIHILWQSNFIQPCFLQNNAQYLGCFFFCKTFIEYFCIHTHTHTHKYRQTNKQTNKERCDDSDSDYFLSEKDCRVVTLNMVKTLNIQNFAHSILSIIQKYIMLPSLVAFFSLIFYSLLFIVFLKTINIFVFNF